MKLKEIREMYPEGTQIVLTEMAGETTMLSKNFLTPAMKKTGFLTARKPSMVPSLLLTILVSTHIESLSVITESSVWTKILLHTM